MSDELETKPLITEGEAVTLAIEALDQAANQYHFDVRAAEMMGERVPLAARRGVVKRAQYLEAKKILQGLNWWDKKAVQ